MSKWNWALCAAVIVPLLFAGVAQADRRESLAGNLLIDDQDDMFLFPNQVNRYRNLISLDYGLDKQTGNALLTLGDERAAYGFALRRGDALAPLGDNLNGPSQFGMRLDIPSLFSTAEFPAGIDQAPATMLDFTYGRMASSFDWGLRASFGRGALVETDENDNDTGAEQLYFMGQFGYGSGVRGQDIRTDLSVSALVDVGKRVSGGNNQSAARAIGVNALLRMYIPFRKNVDIGVLGNLGLRGVTVKDEVASSDHDRVRFNAGGGVGAALRFGNASVSAYGTLRFDLTAEDADSETTDNRAEVGTIGLAIPGLLASVEVPLTDWFFVRSGAQYDFDVLVLRRGDESGGSQVDGQFGWNAGLGVLVDAFRFDGTLAQGFVTNGPNFIGGGNGFLAMASLTYVFDANRDGMNRPLSATQAAAPDASETTASADVQASTASDGATEATASDPAATDEAASEPAAPPPPGPPMLPTAEPAEAPAPVTPANPPAGAAPEANAAPAAPAPSPAPASTGPARATVSGQAAAGVSVGGTKATP